MNNIMITIEIEVALLPSLLRPPAAPEKAIAVVIDTLRFTTSAIQAVVAGAASIAVASDIDAAKTQAAAQAERPLLCGERFCRPIPGFDLGNSPSEYVPERVASKNLLFTTTNGTIAVAACHDFGQCLLGALVNRTAVAEYIADQDNFSHCRVVCAGTDGQVALEDVLAAGAIVAALMNEAAENNHFSVRLTNDAAHLAVELWNQCSQGIETHKDSSIQDRLKLNDQVHSYFTRAAGGLNLIEQGYAADLQFAARVDSLQAVPRQSGMGFVG